MARAELARHAHLRRHRIEVLKGEIVVFEPLGGMSLEEMKGMVRMFGMNSELLDDRLGGMRSRTRFDPVLKFVPEEKEGHYTVHRMTYRGHGGWSWPLSFGPLDELATEYLGTLGTEAFFEFF